MSKVKPILYMVGKGGISVLQTAIFDVQVSRSRSNVKAIPICLGRGA